MAATMAPERGQRRRNVKITLMLMRYANSKFRAARSGWSYRQTIFPAGIFRYEGDDTLEGER
jgi:hypothetical protein